MRGAISRSGCGWQICRRSNVLSQNGVGAFNSGLGKFLGGLFAFFGAAAAFGIGNGVQVNSMAQVLDNSFNIPSWLTGVVVAALVAFVIFGGIKRIADVAGKLVPTMIVLYIGAAMVIILINIAEVPAAFGLIFKHAFQPAAAAGGFAGAAVAAAIRFGVARGVFSNEAGWARRQSPTPRHKPTIRCDKALSPCSALL